MLTKIEKKFQVQQKYMATGIYDIYNIIYCINQFYVRLFSMKICMVNQR